MPHLVVNWVIVTVGFIFILSSRAIGGCSWRIFLTLCVGFTRTISLSCARGMNILGKVIHSGGDRYVTC